MELQPKYGAWKLANDILSQAWATYERERTEANWRQVELARVKERKAAKELFDKRKQ